MDKQYAALVETWYRHLDSHSVMLTGGAHRTVCPVCTDDHPTCRFGTGSLHCVNAPCGNPHHRPPIEEFPF